MNRRISFNATEVNEKLKLTSLNQFEPMLAEDYNNAVFVSGLRFDKAYTVASIEEIVYELFSQFTIIKDIHVFPMKNGDEVTNPILYSSIMTFHDEQDMNHAIKVWEDVRPHVKINSNVITVKKYNKKQDMSTNDKFVSYAVVSIYNILDPIEVAENKLKKKNLIDKIDHELYENRINKVKGFLESIKEQYKLVDINPQLLFLCESKNLYKPFIQLQFENFKSADAFIADNDDIILFENRNLKIEYAYKDPEDLALGQNGDSLQRSLEGEVTST
ncbi:hypothetical protein FOG50_00060 [Hanseniaspora uvarum]|nr:hypothetical protein FOG50_00060 [Hanseniaspora uvarum]